MNQSDPRHGRYAVVSLSRLAPGALSPVLDAQRAEWNSRLGWDLSQIVEFIGSAIDDRSLRGTAVLAGGFAVGYGFFTIEIDRCLIGDLYVTPEARGRDAAAALVSGLLDEIERAKPRRRIESQSIVFEVDGADQVFADRGFTRHERAYMVLDVDPDRALPPAEHPHVTIRSWERGDFGPAIEVVYQAYRNTVDARVNVQYRTRHGCADLVDALTDSPWCGDFVPEWTKVAVDRVRGRCCGVCLASAISPTTAHFSQISVMPSHQGTGVGRALIAASVAAAAADGVSRASLAVTRANRAAVKLYQGLGFAPGVEFPVFVRDPVRLTRRPK